MATVRGIAKDITGKQVVVVHHPDYFFIGPHHIEVAGGQGLKEQVVHEVCHWVIAEDWQREHVDNIGYGHSIDDYLGRDPRCDAKMMERQELMVCHLQRLLYQFAGIPFPTYGSCTFRGRDRGLTDDEIAWMLARCSLVDWVRLAALVRARG